MKIKEAQSRKVPFMLIAGEREAADGSVALRRRDARARSGTAGRDGLNGAAPA